MSEKLDPSQYVITKVGFVTRMGHGNDPNFDYDICTLELTPIEGGKYTADELLGEARRICLTHTTKVKRQQGKG